MPKPKFINKEFLELSEHIDIKKFAEFVRGTFHDFIDLITGVKEKFFTLHGTSFLALYLVI